MNIDKRGVGAMEEMRWWPLGGLAFGTALGFAGAFGGFDAFVLVLVLGVIGFLAGRALIGELDVSGLRGSRRRE